MPTQRVGLLHPGEMGSAVAATLQNAGNKVYWASEGRSRRSRERAEELRLIDSGTIECLSAQCSTIVSVCPPEFADELANRVLACSFRGLFIDANAISPDRAARIGQRVTTSGAHFVDGSIIGLATREPDRVWIYLSGELAEDAAVLFGNSGPLHPEAIDGPVGRASALKMCYAGYNKGSAALLCATLAVAEQLGVRELLSHQWSRSDRNMAGAEKKAGRVAAKAWRFAAEMREIVDTFESAGATPKFHRAAEDVYTRLAAFKDLESPDLNKVLCALLGKAQ
jgi:3-hydroxyisobutyrate dehydrogenase-like beta-hydroxyacid dehydrogenase